MSANSGKKIYWASCAIALALAITAALSQVIFGPPSGTLFAMVCLAVALLSWATGLAFMLILRANPKLAEALARPAPELPVRWNPGAAVAPATTEGLVATAQAPAAEPETIPEAIASRPDAKPAA